MVESTRMRPVPKEDTDRLREAIRENVIKPMIARRKRQAELVAAARRRIIL